MIMETRRAVFKQRELNFCVDLQNSKGLLICVPDFNREKTIAKAIADAAGLFIENIKIVCDVSLKTIVNAGMPVILIGNLANNRIVKDLYYRFLLATDFWYPGPGGYEIRTLLDPYGSGENIIHIGYSDESGLEKAAVKFIPLIEKTINQINEIHPSRLHICESEEKQIRAIKPPELVWMNVARDIYKKGYLGYLTGEKELINAYLDMWRAIVSYPITKDDQKIKDLHLKMSNMIQSFRLLETAGLIHDEELRNKIANYIISWPETDQGLIRIDKQDYMHPEFPRQNHGMIPALGLAFLIDYCKTYSYDIKNMNEWETLVEKAYFPYMKGSWKPVCDGTCHGWWLSQPALLEYGLIEPEHRYFVNGGAKKAADAAMNLVNNNGIMPSSGDFNLLRSFPGISLRHAMAYYSDGRYKFVHDMAPRHLSNKYHVYMPRMFDCGLEPVVPDDLTGINITPMDSLIYNSWEKAPGLVREMLHSGPDVPIDETFDKLSIRTGWEKDDQYLLIDGLGSNSNHTHSYPDALGIIDYYHLGESWIIAENGSKFPEPENNSILTIVRKGEEFLIPSFGELLAIKENDDTYYAAMRLKNYSKTDWLREITLIRDVGLVIQDTVIVNENGDYSICAHFRTPGKAKLNKNEMTLKRNTGCADEKTFAIEAFCSKEFSVGSRENDFSLSYRNHKGEVQPIVIEEDIEAAWENRYHTPERVVTSLDSRIDMQCKTGDRLIFTHLAYALNREDSKPVIHTSNEKLMVTKNNVHWEITSFNPLGTDCDILTGKMIRKPNTVIPDIETKLKNTLSNKLGSVVHSIAVNGDGNATRYYAGYGKQSIACLDNNLNIIWSKEIVRDPSYCYWWELDYPSVVEIKAFSYNGIEYIIAGCGDLFVRCFTNTGEIKWTFQYINGVPGRINIFDSDGDGIPEILVGGEVISNRSQCRVLGLDGRLKYELDAEFWTSRLTAYADAASDNERFVALGANRGRNLHLYRTCSQGNSVPLKMFEKKLAGTITDINIDAAKQSVTAVSTEGFSVTYDFYGNKMDQSSAV